ncbi:reverse transcriptase domain-containing protein [Sporosarcina sp. FA9]|uniref:reverse transcriptase domain-containing protein n=1 Tax=Sporosarcina sp. FA9 TaxID=3413030 RepID=UPI003F65B722
METKLIRIAELAKEQPDMKFTSLIHLLNEENLKRCHHELPAGKATGIKRITKEAYGENLDDNIARLVEKMKMNSYKPIPVRRTYIAKAGSKMKRPLGIPDHEDKIVQKGIAKILNAIYEPIFLDCSFGFRPNRNCHDALKILNVYIEKRHTNFIVDVDN